MSEVSLIEFREFLDAIRPPGGGCVRRIEEFDTRYGYQKFDFTFDRRDAIWLVEIIIGSNGDADLCGYSPLGVLLDVVYEVKVYPKSEPGTVRTGTFKDGHFPDIEAPHGRGPKLLQFLDESFYDDDDRFTKRPATS